MTNAKRLLTAAALMIATIVMWELAGRAIDWIENQLEQVEINV